MSPKTFLASGLGILAFGLYALTLFPSVPGGDSGELITAAYTLGIAHPPGYPLFTLLGKLFSLLPHGSIAWRLNLMSAFFDALAAVLLSLSVSRFSKNGWAGLVAGGMFAFSPAVWNCAVATEVFALNNFFCATLLYLFVRHQEEPSRKWAYLFYLAFGLGLSNHHTLVLIGGPLALFLFWTGRRNLLGWRPFAISTALFTLGLLPYLYLPWASARVPLVTWGDLTTWDGFLTHVLRKEYGSLRLSTIGKESFFWEGLLAYGVGSFKEFAYVGVPLAVAGALSRHRASLLGKALLLAFCFYVILFHVLANLPIKEPVFLGIQMRFWQEPNLIACAWIGAGFAAMCAWLSPRGPGTLTKVAWPALAVILVLFQAALHFAQQDQHDNRVIQRFGETILNSLPNQAILLTVGDLETNSTRYLQQCEGLRKDVHLLDRSMMAYPWMRPWIDKHYPDLAIPPGNYYRYTRSRKGGYGLDQFIIANLPRFPTYVVPPAPNEDKSWEQALSLWPFGFVNKAYLSGESIDLREYVRTSEAALNTFDWSRAFHMPKTSWESTLASRYWAVRERRALALLDFGLKNPADPIALGAGIAAYEKLIAEHPAPDASFYKNLGLAYNQQRTKDPGATGKMTAAWKKYLQIAPQSDNQLPAIRKILAESGVSLP